MHSIGVRSLGLVGVGAAVALSLCSFSVGCSSGGGTTNPLPNLGNLGNPGNPPGGSVDAGSTKPDTGGSVTPGQDAGGTPATDSGPGGSSDAPPTPPPASTISASTTWADGQQIAVSTAIAAGVTVTIAPGATVTFASGTSLTIEGTLTAASATGTHATLTAAAGGTWTGLVVASGGTLALDGVDITSAATAIETQGGNTAATYDDGTITGAATPFKVDKGSTLSTTHGTTSGTQGASAVLGSFTASYLTYAKGASSEGIVMQDPTATMSIEDSTLTGSGPAGDMVVSATGASLHMAYSTISNVHCAFHFDSIDAFDVSYTTADGNAWAAMLYGSTPGAGPYSIKDSNFAQNSSYALDEEGTNGTITVDSCYIAGQDQGVTATNPKSAAIATAKPR
jgi:hypothetical protein